MTAASPTSPLLPISYGSAIGRSPALVNNSSNRTRHHVVVKKESRLIRERFVIFLQILLRQLEASQAHQLKQQAKVLVMQCTRNNKMMGSTSTNPSLVESLELNLRQLVGEVHWRTAFRATHRYFIQKEQQRLLFQIRYAQQVLGLNNDDGSFLF